MLSSRLILSIFVFLLLSNGVSIVSAASVPQSPTRAAQAQSVLLAVEYHQICKTTEKHSPEYRAAIEQVLKKHQERGGTDAFEQKLRHCLGSSYRQTEQYAKSTEVLLANLDTGDDLEMKSIDMLWIARNARDSNNLDEAIRLMEELASAYPKTSGGQTAIGELPRLAYRKKTLDLEKVNAGQIGRKGVFVVLNLAALAILVAIFIRRQMKRGSSD